MNDLDSQKFLFMKGIDSFNNQKYYDAHEFWEKLWSEYPLKDALFIQGLIQASVAYFHITNLNLRGSKNLFNKSLPFEKSTNKAQSAGVPFSVNIKRSANPSFNLFSKEFCRVNLIFSLKVIAMEQADLLESGITTVFDKKLNIFP